MRLELLTLSAFENFFWAVKGPDQGKMILELFWELKNLNIALIYYGIQKLINDKNPIPAKSIRIGPSDIIDKVFDAPKVPKQKKVRLAK